MHERGVITLLIAPLIPKKNKKPQKKGPHHLMTFLAKVKHNSIYCINASTS